MVKIPISIRYTFSGPLPSHYIWDILVTDITMTNGHGTTLNLINVPQNLSSSRKCGRLAKKN